MKLKEELTLRQLGDDYIIVEPGQDMLDFSRVYTLNESAALLWLHLQSREFTLEMMANLLLEHYGLDESHEKQVKNDVLRLTIVLNINGLLYDF